jgi:hypothetical protein
LSLGLGWGFEPMRESHPSGPSEPRVGQVCLFVLLPLFHPLPHLRRRLCVCTCIRLDMVSLALSHYYLSMALYISLPCLRVYHRMSLRKKQRQVQS